MIQIRKGIFETNSSSTHALCISNQECEYETVNLNERGEIELLGQSFDYDFRAYNDFTSKANYLVGCISRYRDRDKLRYLLQKVKATIAKQLAIKADQVRIDLEGVKEQGVQVFPKRDLQKLVQGDLRDFLFNPKSVVYVGNDWDEDTSVCIKIHETRGTYSTIIWELR